MKDGDRGKDMKTISIPQVRPISGSNPQEAAMLFNEAIRELAPMHPTFVREGDTYYITYTVEYSEAETLSEKYEMKGEAAHCGDCPFCVRDLNRFGDVDERKKHATCVKLNGQRSRIDARACDIYYAERGDEH